MYASRHSFIIGVVVNPRSGEPCIAVKQRDWYRTIGIYTAHGNYIGKGYFNGPDDDEDYRLPEEASGYPRVHTPHGVKPAGQGYGTCLYVSLCVAAHLNHKQRLTFSDIGANGDGISSGKDSRSGSAERWWNKAVELGLAEEDSDTVEVRKEFDDEDFSDEFDTSDLEVGDMEVTYIDCLRLSGKKETEEEIDYNTMDFDQAFDNDLVICSMIQDGGADSELDSKHVIDVNTQALVALNLTDVPKHFVKFLVETAKDPEIDIDQKLIDDMLIRNALNIDPDADDITPNPGRRRRNPALVPSAGDVPTRRVAAALERTQEIREKTDWSALAALP